MEAQPQHTDIRYPLPSSLHPNQLLYKLRYRNDELLLDMTRTHLQNQKLQSTINHLTRNIPAFLLDWWNSSQSKQKINVFLQQLSVLLHEQIEIIQRKIYEFRTECQVNEADYEQEVKVNGQLMREVGELQSKLDRMRLNAQQMKQLENIYQSHNINTLTKSTYVRSQLQMAADRQKQFKQQINARFSQRTAQNNEQDYYNELQFLVNFLIDRKKLMKDKLQQIEHNNQQYNQIITAEQQQTEIKYQLKKSIIQKRTQLDHLHKQLRQAKHEKELQSHKFKEMEHQYCLQEMDRVVGRVRDHRERSDILLKRSMVLLSAVEQHPNLAQIEKNLTDY